MFESEFERAEKLGCGKLGEGNWPCLGDDGTESGQENEFPFSVFWSSCSTAGDELESLVQNLEVVDNVSIRPTS